MHSDREPAILDYGCYWLICLPVQDPEHPDWWAGIVWHKQQHTPLTVFVPMTLEDLKREAAKIVDCEETA